ncbi:peptidylprolyl isomerase [Croceibacterium ferulae]|uniref:peptidylprolyl isomerase n=1 Tax=Croceibacterium ferulae TaxID=1854641 RepID=UPI000EB33832|nr:peptidylprolyl isomerase [Croceibacterium ferulae]
MLKRFALPLLLLALPATAQEPAPSPPQPEPALTEVILQTTQGPITVALETERAPLTAGNFLAYVDSGKFDGTVFYRAMRLDWGEQPNGLIQGGTQNDPDRILPPVAHERTSDTGVLHTVGAISMARLEPGSATGDFSIMLSPQPGLDADPASDDPELREGYAAFGHVTAGMDVVRAIFDAPVDPAKGEGWMKGQMLAEPVRIVTARRVEAAAE